MTRRKYFQGLQERQAKMEHERERDFLFMVDGATLSEAEEMADDWELPPDEEFE